MLIYLIMLDQNKIYKQSLSPSQVLVSSDDMATKDKEGKPKPKYSKPKDYKPKKRYGPQIRTQLASSNSQIASLTYPTTWESSRVNYPTWGLLGALVYLEAVWNWHCEKARKRGCNLYEENINHGYSCKCCTKIVEESVTCSPKQERLTKGQRGRPKQHRGEERGTLR
jgi:hypothetical protein